MKILHTVFRPCGFLCISSATTALLSILLLSGATTSAAGISFAWAVLALSCSGLLAAAIAAARLGKSTDQAVRELAGEISLADSVEEGEGAAPGERYPEQFQPMLEALSGLRERLGQASAPDLLASIRQVLPLLELDLMLTNDEDQIVFMSEALGQSLKSIRGDSLAGTGSLVGSPVTVLTDDADVKNTLRWRKTQPMVTEIEQGESRFRLRVRSLHDEAGNFIGNLTVWEDRSADSRFERHIQELVKSASAGDLTSRVEAPTTRGFKYNLAAGINDLMALCESVIVDTTRVLGALAAGRLDETIDTEYQGAFEKLKLDANSTVTRLRDVVANIQQSSESVSTAFREINEGNLNLSQRTEQQAASLEETSCSMEEMTATVQKNAENAQRANDLAIKARDEAQNGGRVVGQAVTAMTEINAASEKIADIIGVIDEIAFQTNLLALNASVEAARAGEQGRGFAVVAGEVRNLAGRSAEAAKEIKDLIQDSVTKVENGSALVNQSGQTLDQIVAGVQEVTDIVAEISSASMEQASGIAEVNATITQMDDMTQQNAALVEEVSAASESAGEQAQNLSTLITFFQTDHLPPAPAAEITPFSPTDNPPLQQRWTPAPVTAISGASGAAQAANSELSGDWEEF